MTDSMVPANQNTLTRRYTGEALRFIKSFVYERQENHLTCPPTKATVTPLPL
jgi:hypothetical protein